MIARIAATGAWVTTLLMGIATLWGLFTTDFLRQVSGGVMDEAMIVLTVLGLAWAILSGMVVAVYAGAVLLLQGLLAGMTQGQTLAVAASTLLAAVLFQPLRVRLQRAMDRRFDRARYDSERIADTFAARLRDQVDLRGLEADVTDTVRSALRPGSIEVWIRRDRELLR